MRNLFAPEGDFMRKTDAFFQELKLSTNALPQSAPKRIASLLIDSVWRLIQSTNSEQEFYEAYNLWVRDKKPWECIHPKNRAECLLSLFYMTRQEKFSDGFIANLWTKGRVQDIIEQGNQEDSRKSFSWDRLTPEQVSKLGEDFAKVQFAKHGFEVFASSVADKGVDFIVCTIKGYVKVQVRTVRKGQSSLVKGLGEDFNSLLALVRLVEGNDHPELYLIPGVEIEKNDQLLIRKNESEYGISITNKSAPLLQSYIFEEVLSIYEPVTL